MISFMSFQRSIRCVSLIALAIMVFAALAPTITRSMPHGQGSGYLEVCTAEGIRVVAVAQDGNGQGIPAPQSPSHSTQDHGNDCPFCNLQFSKFLPPSDTPRVAPQRVSHLPPLFYRAPKPLFAWAQTRSRAPPRLT